MAYVQDEQVPGLDLLPTDIVSTDAFVIYRGSTAPLFFRAPGSLLTKTLVGLSNVANVDTTDASNISSGTLPDGRFPATLPAVSGANLTNVNAATATVANEATDTTCFPVFVTAATGNLAAKSNAGLTFNSATGVLAATGFSGPLTGNVTGNCSGSSGSCTGNAATASAVALGGITGLGTGVGTALAINVGSAGAFITFNGDAGTPSALVGTNISGTAASLTAGAATVLSTTRTIGGSNFDGSGNVTSFPEPGAIGGTTPSSGTFTTLVAGSTTSLLLGTAGSAVGNIGFRNATSGTATLAPPTGALGTYSVTLPNAVSTLPIFGQQMTFAGPTAARTITLPDAAFTVAGLTVTQTLTNKRVTPRTGTVASAAEPTIDTDAVDIFTITALAVAITSMTTNLSGTPTIGQKLVIRFKDDGTGRAISWGASFASRGATLPTTTTANKTTYAGLIWNGVASTWDCVAAVTEA